MTERFIEEKLVKAVKKQNGICPKFVAPGCVGMPDRIVLLPGGRVSFVEVKAPGQKPRPIQVVKHEQLRKLGFQVFVLDDVQQIADILEKTGGAAV